MRNVAAAWRLEFPLFIFPSSVQTVSVRVELTELFIASLHTRLHLASSSSSSSPRGGTGQGSPRGRAGHQAPGKEMRTGESLEGNEGQGAEQRRCAEWRTMACKVERSWGKENCLQCLTGDRSCFGRDLRREMSGSYFLVSMGALNEIILRQPLPGGVLGSW